MYRYSNDNVAHSLNRKRNYRSDDLRDVPNELPSSTPDPSKRPKVYYDSDNDEIPTSARTFMNIRQWYNDGPGSKSINTASTGGSTIETNFAELPWPTIQPEAKTVNARALDDLDKDVFLFDDLGKDGRLDAAIAPSRGDECFINPDEVNRDSRQNDRRWTANVPDAMMRMARGIVEGSENGVGATQYTMGEVWRERMRLVLRTAASTTASLRDAEPGSREVDSDASFGIVEEWQQSVGEDITGRERALAGEKSLNDTISDDALMTEDWLRQIEEVLAELAIRDSSDRTRSLGKAMDALQIEDLSEEESLPDTLPGTAQMNYLINQGLDILLGLSERNIYDYRDENGQELPPAELERLKAEQRHKAKYQEILSREAFGSPGFWPDPEEEEPAVHKYQKLLRAEDMWSLPYKPVPKPTTYDAGTALRSLRLPIPAKSPDMSASPLYFGRARSLLFNILSAMDPEVNLASVERLERLDVEAVRRKTGATQQLVVGRGCGF